MLRAVVGSTSATLIVVVMFAGCAPRAQSPSNVAVLDSVNPTYIPHHVGSWWSYLPEAEGAGSPTVTTEIIGRTLVHDEPVTMWEIQGRGLDRMLHRHVNDEGMFLVREVRPDVTFTFEPPLHELPAAPLSVGQRWNGITAVYASSMADPTGEALPVRTVTYAYTVIGTRKVQLPTHAVEVFEIHFAASESTDESTTISRYEQVTWFAPYVGEIRTAQGHLLRASSLLP